MNFLNANTKIWKNMIIVITKLRWQSDMYDDLGEWFGDMETAKDNLREQIT